MKIVIEDYIGDYSWRDLLALPFGLLGFFILKIAVMIGSRFTAWIILKIFKEM